MGYWRAGFQVTGVDIRPMPRYPFAFWHADALEFVAAFGHLYSAIHASPPCQGYSRTARFNDFVHADLIAETRELLIATGRPYVIENVHGAPLISSASVELCGCMFPGRLYTYRPRLFETNWYLPTQAHRPHVARTAPLGRRPGPGEFMHVVGNPTGAEESRRAMGIDWMQRRELCEAIPPPFCEYVGSHLLAEVARREQVAA